MSDTVDGVEGDQRQGEAVGDRSSNESDIEMGDGAKGGGIFWMRKERSPLDISPPGKC